MPVRFVLQVGAADSPGNALVRLQKVCRPKVTASWFGSCRLQLLAIKQHEVIFHLLQFIVFFVFSGRTNTPDGQAEILAAYGALGYVSIMQPTSHNAYAVRETRH